MRHESNWLEYLRKLANEGPDPSLRANRHSTGAQSGMGILHTPHHRDEWLQAGYAAQKSLPFRSGR